MQLDLREVFRDDGSSLAIDHQADYSGCEIAGGFPLKTPVSVVGQVGNRAGVVLLSVQADFTYSAPCDRCTAMSDKRMQVAVEHVLVTSLNHEDNDELLLLEEEKLDLDDLVLTDILLALPSKYLCTEHCKGLCMQCGKNLNTGLCGCRRAIDPRWEVLRQLLEDSD